MNRLSKVTLHKLDPRSNVGDVQQVTLYQYNKRALVTKVIDITGVETLYGYDGNGNLISKADADGYLTEDMDCSSRFFQMEHIAIVPLQLR